MTLGQEGETVFIMVVMIVLTWWHSHYDTESNIFRYADELKVWMGFLKKWRSSKLPDLVLNWVGGWWKPVQIGPPKLFSPVVLHCCILLQCTELLCCMVLQMCSNCAAHYSTTAAISNSSFAGILPCSHCHYPTSRSKVVHDSETTYWIGPNLEMFKLPNKHKNFFTCILGYSGRNENFWNGPAISFLLWTIVSACEWQLYLAINYW